MAVFSTRHKTYGRSLDQPDRSAQHKQTLLSSPLDYATESLNTITRTWNKYW